MEKTYTGAELEVLGFTLINDGGDEYYQKVLDPEDYWNSPFQYGEEVGNDKYVIKEG